MQGSEETVFCPGIASPCIKRGNSVLGRVSKMATDNSTPLSFKKRTASKTLMSRDGPPGRLDLPKSPFASNASTPTQLRSPSGSPAPGLANRKLRQPSRVVSNGNRRVSTATRQSVKSNQHNEGDPFTAADTTQDGMEETKAPVPSMLPDYNPPTYVTPLPKTSMLVLCICMLAEFLSASTVSPISEYLELISYSAQKKACRIHVFFNRKYAFSIKNEKKKETKFSCFRLLYDRYNRSATRS